MKKEKSLEKELRQNKLLVLFCSIIEGILVLMEIYAMIYASTIVVGIIGLVIVVDLFFLVSALIELSQHNKEMELREYEGIYQAQKASYLITKKNFDELQRRIASLESNNSFPADEIISAQKAVAKVTISRNKENADALMNSNDELISQLIGFQEKLESNNEVLLKQQEDILDKTKEELLDRNSEILAKNEALEAKVLELTAALEEMKQNGVAVAAPEMEVAPEVEPEPVAEVEAEPEVEVEPEAEVEPEVEAEPEAEVEPEVEAEPEVEIEPEVIEEPVAEPEPEPEPEPAPVDDDPNKMMSPEDIEALLAAANVDEPEVVAEPEEEIAPEVEPEVIEEPEAEPEPAPVDDDPNKMMSPEDIEALLAAVNVDEPAAEESVEEEPAQEEPAAEESSSVADAIADLDTSDPNKVMSADEIAALFANV